MFKKSKVFIALTLVLALLVSMCSAATYTVKKGDNLWRIASEQLGSGAKWQEIYEANKDTIKDPDLIYVDQVLEIPDVPGIVGVETIGFVDKDGSKTKAVVVEYNVDMTGADVDLSDYEVEDYGTSLADKDLDSGSADTAGEPLKIYVNDKPEISAEGGSGTGNYVIIEVDTDYAVSRFARSWKITMAASVKQVGEIVTGNGTVIAPSDEAVVNYEQEVYIGFNPMTGQPRDPEYYNYAIDGTYTIEGIEDYELHTIEAGTAFKAVDCFDEANGQYWDLDLPYALYVPDDYDASKEYALVLHIHDAGSMSSDPRLTLTEGQGPANFASEEFQQLAKDQGLGGAIVVCPAIEEFYYMNEENPEYDLRASRDNWTLSCAVPAVWQLMDYLTKTYSVDMDRIYGTGQSMGGMTVMAMAAQRDNYFAGLLPIGCQWGQNFNKEYEFNGKTMYNAPADDVLIYSKDEDGNEYDYNNWYYVCSDDNILFLWTDEQTEFMTLYRDLCGVEVESASLTLDAETNTTNEERSAIIDELVSRESDLGMYYVYMNGTVGHMSSWFYGHGTFGAYEWLMSQNRQTEVAREKLDLNKPFVWADEQLQDEAHIYSTEKDGTVIYYPTGKAGSGTAGYNSACSALGSKEKLNPGWQAPGIVGVETIGFVDMDGSKTAAIVVEYNVDMTGADVDLSDYEVNDYGTSLADKDLDSGSAETAGEPVKIYVNDKPEISAEGGSGTGNYVIIEVDTDYAVSRFARSWKITMAADVKQVNEIVTGDGTVIAPSREAKENYEQEVYIGFNPMTGQPRDPEYYNYAIDGTYTIEGIEGYELCTIENGKAFKAVDCFDEANGQYWDFDLPYALYVPDDYDASKEYALVLHIHDAGSMSSDPRLTLTEGQGPANFASEEFQQLAKDQGLGGAIVVCPAVDEFFYMNEENPEYELRMARDNWTLSCGCPAIWQLMDYITETYSIDMNRIYGTGQSMGGMTVMAMAAQRDNYFAGLLPIGCQWGQNFNKEFEFNGVTYQDFPADDVLVYSKTEDGEEYDFNNWYYVCSDDNILYLWTDETTEFMVLFEDLLGIEVEQASMTLDGETNTTNEERSAIVEELTSRESDMGWYYVYMNGTVGHMSSWFYGHGTFGAYEWLMSQTKETETAREKLDLNKPFELADEQLQDDAHIYSTEKDGTVIYYPTGKAGSGTVGYNSACSALGSKEKLNPGWTPAD